MHRKAIALALCITWDATPADCSCTVLRPVHLWRCCVASKAQRAVRADPEERELAGPGALLQQEELARLSAGVQRRCICRWLGGAGRCLEGALIILARRAPAATVSSALRRNCVGAGLPRRIAAQHARRVLPCFRDAGGRLDACVDLGERTCVSKAVTCAVHFHSSCSKLLRRGRASMIGQHIEELHLTCGRC